MKIFTKQQICQYLAEKNVEMIPAFELRKLKVSESVLISVQKLPGSRGKQR